MYTCMFFLQPPAVYCRCVYGDSKALCLAVSNRLRQDQAYLVFASFRFPVDHFNRLMGIYGTVTAVLMFLQYPHFIWAQHMYYTAHTFVLVLTVLCVTYPLHLLFTPLVRHAVIARDGNKQNQLLGDHTTAQTSVTKS
ncbi:hypothetical protein GWK47_049497 [Chionoecetes opilio]|uniref:Uncharacterized protein n=1 Tax=Chionoecetes opilio TaxID=41210 RepID=A0A8J4YBQ9_CHIOP|nr:hypothetical protein GWK47_049497 [Chionoecetes opilio]